MNPLQRVTATTALTSAAADRIDAVLNRLHARAQAIRAAKTFAASFVAFLAFAPHDAYSFKLIGAAALAAFEAVWHQFMPSVPPAEVVNTTAAAVRTSTPASYPVVLDDPTPGAPPVQEGPTP